MNIEFYFNFRSASAFHMRVGVNREPRGHLHKYIPLINNTPISCRLPLDHRSVSQWVF